jgi:hypothetical protein
MGVGVKMLALMSVFMLMHGAVDMGMQVRVGQSAKGMQQSPHQIRHAETKQQPARQFGSVALQILKPQQHNAAGDADSAQQHGTGDVR